MRISRLFVPQELSSDSTLELGADSAHYLGRVLRLREGAQVTLFNGQGGEYPARILSYGKKSAHLQVGQCKTQECESPLSLTLVQGIARNEHMDWVMQKATELGATAIAPVICARTQQGKAEKFARRAEHWQRIIENACEQCGRNRLPQLHPVQTLAAWLETDSNTCRLTLEPLAGQLWQELPVERPASLSLLIGPEGGLSDAELSLLKTQSWQGVRLGPRILRTETAALSALTLAQARWGDL